MSKLLPQLSLFECVSQSVLNEILGEIRSSKFNEEQLKSIVHAANAQRLRQRMKTWNAAGHPRQRVPEPSFQVTWNKF